MPAPFSSSNEPFAGAVPFNPEDNQRGVAMTSAAVPDQYRVTVISPRKRVDLALPAHVAFADLFPGIALYAGLDRAAVAEAPEGWALQRLGEPPFEPPATPAQAGMADGELLYLRPWRNVLPPVVSDDIADEIAGVHDGPGRWSPADGRRVALGAAVAALAAGLAILLRSGPPWTGPALAAGLLAVLLLAAGAAVSRAAGDAAAGAVLGSTALPFAFAAGLLAPLRGHPLSHVSAVAVLAGFVLLTVAALIAGLAVARGLAVFAGVTVAGVFGAAAAALAWLWPGLTPAGAAGLVVAPALALTPLIPAVAFRLARLPLPAVLASAGDLRDDALLEGARPATPGWPTPSRDTQEWDAPGRDGPGVDVRDRAAAADRVVTGAVSSLGLLGGGAAIVLGLSRGGVAPVLAAALACALLLRSRVFRGRAQRLWLLIPGYGGLIWLAVAVAGTSLRAVGPVLLALVVAAAIGVGAALPRPGHRPSPFWSRAADIADTVLIISLVPLALAVAGIFGVLHGLGG
jgi:type VII secretion integral membrane protein EccD